MARIPRADITQRKIATTPTTPRQTRTGMPEAIGRAGEAITSVSGMIENLRVNEETSRADNSFMKSLMQIEHEAVENTDTSPQKQAEFKQRINTAQMDAARFITQPLARDNFSAKSRSKGNISQSKIDGIFGSKIIDMDRANIQENLDLLKENYVISGNEKGRASLMKEAQDMLTLSANNGTISREIAAIRKIEIQDEWAFEDVLVDINTHAENTLEELNKGKKGIYPGLKTKDRQDLILQAEQQIIRDAKRVETLKAEKQAQIEAQWNSADGMAINQYLNKSVSAEDIQAMAEEGKISPQVGKGIAGISLSKGSVKAKTDDKIYFNLLENFYTIDDSDHKAINKWRASILAAQERTKLSREDANELITKSLVPLQGKKTVKPQKTVIGQALSQIRDWTTLVIDEPGQAIAQSRMARTMFRALLGTEITAESIERAQNIAIAEEQKKINPNRAMYEINKVYTSPRGAFKVIGYREDGEPMIEVQ